MANKPASINISVESIKKGGEIAGVLAELKPNTSLSFTLSEEGYAAIKETIRLVEWGMGKNMQKLKEAALGVLSPFLDDPAGNPLNVNLTEQEVKSLQEVHKLVERSVKRERDGVLSRRGK